MKRFLCSLLVAVMILGLCGCSSEQSYTPTSFDSPSTPTPDPKVYPPFSSYSCEGKHYEDVIDAFEYAGFTNVSTRPIEDLVTGWLKSDGEVEEVAINGDTDYSSSKGYEPDAKVVVAYHTFPENPSEEPTEVPSESPSEEPIEIPSEVPPIDPTSAPIIPPIEDEPDDNISVKYAGYTFTLPSRYEEQNLTSVDSIAYSAKSGSSENLASMVIFQEPIELDSYSSSNFDEAKETFAYAAATGIMQSLDGESYLSGSSSFEDMSVENLNGWMVYITTDNNGVDTSVLATVFLSADGKSAGVSACYVYGTDDLYNDLAVEYLGILLSAS